MMLIHFILLLLVKYPVGIQFEGYPTILNNNNKNNNSNNNNKPKNVNALISI